MKRIYSSIFFCGFIAVGTVAEPEGVEQREMVVQAQPIHSAHVIGQDASVAVALAATPGIRVTNQGVPGGQSDLSIRGSSFSGAGISLNGLALSSAQTEHFNAELPVVSGLLSAPRILTGVDQVKATEGHLVGTASFGIMPVETGRSLTLGVAEDHGYWFSTLLQESRPSEDGTRSIGLGAFGSYTEINAVDYTDNNVRSSRGGGQLQVVSETSQWDLLVAHQAKRFGARGYYGVTPTWNAEEETEDTLIFGSWLRGKQDEHYIRTSLMRREQTDDYMLFWSFPGMFRNEHRTTTHSGIVDGREFLGANGVLDWRVHAQNERISSSGLGYHERSRGGVTLLPGITWEDWTFTLGVRQEFFEGDSSETLPQGAIELALAEGLALRLSHSQSVRQPSFTELNYESPASLGNAGLENQTAETTELRATGVASRAVSWHVALFQRTTHDAVDWIRDTAEASRWAAQNLDRLETEGVEAGISLKASGGSRILAQYAYLHKTTDSAFYSSRYAFDYPEHHFLLSALWQVTTRAGIEFTQNIRQQADNPLRGSSDDGYDGALALHLLPFHDPHVQLSLMVNNLWDDEYEAFPDQKTVSPRRVSAGVTIDW